MINIYYESLLLAPNRVLAHGVSCYGSFNTGLARQIKRLYPEVKDRYLKKYHGPGWHLGDIQLVPCQEDKRVIANIGIQGGYSKVGNFVDYCAVQKGLDSLFRICKDYNQIPALSKIGCGIGGGDWAIVSRIIKETSDRYNLDADLYIYQKK